MYNFKLTDLRIRYFFVLCFVSLLLTSCDSSKTKFNVVIVTFDTTRADHIGSYNNENYTPVLNQLAKDGVVFEKAIAPIPITLPSHSTIMTGKVPFAHGVRDNGLFNLADEQTTLAEILKENGYNTAATIGSFPLTSQFGINQGFDFFNDHITQNREDMFGEYSETKSHLFFDERKAAQVNEVIMPWIEDHANSPFFVWFHYFDPHHPHEPPAPYNQSFVHDLYKGEIAYSDESLGKVIAQLKRLNVYDNTLIVFTSDHGEGNNEHNESTHSLLIYNSTLHVPLIVKYPNQLLANTRISNWVGLVDILPTILDTLGIAIPNDIQGQVLPTENFIDPKNEIYSETLSPRFSRGWGEQRGLIKNGYKYIYGPFKELYNLTKDPHEINNLIDEEPKLASSMKNDLQEYIDEHQVTANPNSSVNLDPETLDTLRGLGYIQSTGSAVEVFVEELNDEGDAPQLHANTNSSYSTAKDLLYKGKYIDSIRYIDSLISEDPENIAYKELKIQAEMGLGNYASVQSLLNEIPVDNYGTITPAKKQFILGMIDFKENNFANAKEHLLESESLKNSIKGQHFLSLIAASENDLSSQQIHLKNLLKLDELNIEALNALAINYSLTDDILLAEETFIKVILANPYHQLSRYNYGVFLNSMNDIDSAQEQFQKAIEINSSYVLAHYALIETYTKQKNKSMAESALQILNTLAPSHKLTNQAQNLINDL